ncbi:hypothetical protein AAKU61_004080 [Undibacterium sp. GrIS 1.2]|uniref:hypothetical protein n=1 Tax=Undibacterium sp. GrIS 1.2 TaxID=3143933 RepID=UPI00339A10BF
MYLAVSEKNDFCEVQFQEPHQPSSLKYRTSIAANFDAHPKNMSDIGDDSDWVRNPITQELLDVLNDRAPSPLDVPEDTVTAINEDPMIYSDHFDNGTPLVLTQSESLMILDMMENPPPRNAAFLEMMARHEAWKDAQWQQTKPIVCRSGFIDPKDGSDEMIVPVPEKLLQELGWTVGDVLDIKINENKELVLRKAEIK